jgi:isopentenyl-diphosphate delta-isomerase
MQLERRARDYMNENVILVDERDNPIGVAEKLEAHRTGKLHRAISVFIFNTNGEMLLQKRAKSKYHSGGLWTNTCCSHPRPNESNEVAAHRRLQEEMGFDCPLSEIHAFVYRVDFENGLTEHEYDHVFIGTFDGSPHPESQEAEDWKWISPATLKKDVAEYPDNYTYWFRLALNDVLLRSGA